MNIQELQDIIKQGYESEISMADAERHAARFLHVQLQLSTQLRTADLDARMKKTALKAVRAAVYLQEASRGEKKPSDVMLEALVNQNTVVISAQDDLDTAEVSRNELQNQFDVFHEAHVFFRGVAKGRFE